jgi:type I restriction enzyme S subunit
MSWRLRQLGEFISIKHGWAFKGEHFTDSGEYIVLTPGNAYESGGLKLRPGKEKYYSGEFPPEYLMKAGDILVVMTDLVQAAPILGGAIVIPEDDRFLHNQRLGLVELLSKEAIDPEFLYYLLNSPNYKAQVRASATGATVRHSAPKRICECNVLVPDSVSEQRQVAQMLSAYDDLIATNQRRIALLEQAGRLLYREWFVQLRFPGCESVQRSSELPAGWRRGTLDQLMFLQRGFDLPNGARLPGDVPVYASTGINGFHNEARALGPGVVTGRSGTLGQVHYVAEDYWPLNTALWVKEFRLVSPCLAYFVLSEMDLAQFNSGASVPTLDRKTVHQADVLIPPASVVEQFDHVVQPMFDEIQALRSHVTRTAKARDLLLPKLMSGQLDVSRIPLPEGEAVAS